MIPMIEPTSKKKKRHYVKHYLYYGDVVRDNTKLDLQFDTSHPCEQVHTELESDSVPCPEPSEKGTDAHPESQRPNVFRFTNSGDTYDPRWHD